MRINILKKSSTKAERIFYEILKKNKIKFCFRKKIDGKEIDFIVQKSIDWISFNKVKNNRMISLAEEERRRKISKNNGRYWLGKQLPIEMKTNISDSVKKLWENVDYKKRLIDLYKGKKLSEETKIKMSETAKRIGTGKWMIGKKFPEELKTKMSLIAKEKKFGSHLPSRKGIESSNDTKQKQSEWHINNPNRKFKDTSIELAIEEELKTRNIYYLKQIPLENISITDFYLPEYKVVIFCDGDYWHDYPNGTDKDRIQTEKLDFFGYKVFRFWEKDIKNSVSECIDEVIKFIQTIKKSYAIEIDGHEQSAKRNKWLIEKGFIPLHYRNNALYENRKDVENKVLDKICQNKF